MSRISNRFLSLAALLSMLCLGGCVSDPEPDRDIAMENLVSQAST